MPKLASKLPNLRQTANSMPSPEPLLATRASSHVVCSVWKRGPGELYSWLNSCSSNCPSTYKVLVSMILRPMGASNLELRQIYRRYSTSQLWSQVHHGLWSIHGRRALDMTTMVIQMVSHLQVNPPVCCRHLQVR